MSDKLDDLAHTKCTVIVKDIHDSMHDFIAMLPDEKEIVAGACRLVYYNIMIALLEDMYLMYPPDTLKDNLDDLFSKLTADIIKSHKKSHEFIKEKLANHLAKKYNLDDIK